MKRGGAFLAALAAVFAGIGCDVGSDGAALGQSLSPSAYVTSVTKDSEEQTPVTFTLAQSRSGSWAVYDHATKNTHPEGVSLQVVGADLSLYKEGGVPAASYYVTVTEPGKSESRRLALQVRKPDAGLSVSPKASVTTVSKISTSQTTVNFMLSASLYGTWTVYNSATSRTYPEGVSVSVKGMLLTLSKTGGVPAGTYYVSLTEPDKSESQRLALTVKDPGRLYEWIEITTLPRRLSYLMGEELDLSGIALKAVRSNGEEEVLDAGSAVPYGDTWTAGTSRITVAVERGNAAFDVTVSRLPVSTGLPLVYIDTEGGAGVTSKEDYVNAVMSVWRNGGKIHENTLRIKGRGNATWNNYPKKPYKIKLDSKADFFGMGADKDWVLLANYTDKTLLRVGLAFYLGKLMDFAWTPDEQFVELILNGEHLGEYQLVEGIKQDAERVNVNKDTGYIFEKDNYYDQEPKYFLTNAGYGYSFKHPDTDDLTDEQWNYLRRFMNEFEAILDSEQFDDPVDGYQKYIDIESFARWFLFQNVLANQDPNPYLTKMDNTADSKVHMGPVWDFEWSLGIGWYDGERPRPADFWVWDGWYFGKLLQSPAFTDKVKELWNAYKLKIRSGVLWYIDKEKLEIAQSAALNFRRWDILNSQISAGALPLGSFEAEVECDRQFFINHFNWLDGAINGL